MPKIHEWYVGVDWGSATHQWCLMDHTGRVHGERAVAHTQAAVQDAVQWVATVTQAPPTAVAVAIEAPHGALVDTLLAQGWLVYAINPKQLDRFRDRFSAGGAKDDRRDARVAADALRTDRRAFRRVVASDPRVVQLREASRLREDLQTEMSRLANQLREQLYRVDAAWLTLSPAADDPWLWTLLTDTPDPAGWAGLSRRRIETALRAHHIRRVTATTVQTALRSPRLTVAPGVTAAVALRIRALVAQLLVVHEQRATTDRHLDQLLVALATPAAGEAERGEHRDVEILRSLPGVGRIVAATMLAEAAGALATRDYRTLRTYAGTGPVTKRSGKALIVHMRYACHPRLRQALYHWSRASLTCDASARTYYDQLRARGHGHARALRSVADRWLRILVVMLKTRHLYQASGAADAPLVSA